MGMARNVTTNIDSDATNNRVPTDRFGVRLAMIRAERQWNIKEAGIACGVNEISWARWEHGGSPTNYEAVCRRIADIAGYSLAWLKAGGPLDSRWNSPPDLRVLRGGLDAECASV